MALIPFDVILFTPVLVCTCIWAEKLCFWLGTVKTSQTKGKRKMPLNWSLNACTKEELERAGQELYGESQEKVHSTICYHPSFRVEQ